MSSRLALSQRFRHHLHSAVAWVFEHVGMQELYLWLGLLLLGLGGWRVHPAIGLMVPGAVLAWMSLPVRPPFVLRDLSGRRKREG